MSIEWFETRAVDILRFLIWILFLPVLGFLLYSWITYFEDIVNRGYFYPLLGITLTIGVFSLLFSFAAFPRVRIDGDGVHIRTFHSMYFSRDEAKVKADGWILRLGGWIFGGRYIPFKRRECAEWIEGRWVVPTAKPPKRILMGVYLYPPHPLHIIFCWNSSWEFRT